jgi:hypothetical protein
VSPVGASFGLILVAVTLVIGLKAYWACELPVSVKGNRALFRLSACLFLVSLLNWFVPPLLMASSVVLLSIFDYDGAKIVPNYISLFDYDNAKATPYYLYPFVYREFNIFCRNADLLCSKGYLLAEMDISAAFATIIGAARATVGLLCFMNGGLPASIWSAEKRRTQLQENPRYFYKLAAGLLLWASLIPAVLDTGYYSKLMFFNRMIHVTPAAAVIFLTFLFAVGVTGAAELFLLTVWKLTRSGNTSEGKAF